MATSIQQPADSPVLARGFLFGAATSAYQVEGSAAADGRVPSIWDIFSVIPGKVRAGDTGAVACDHYRRWMEDVALVKQLGLDAYRLSIAWPRVMDEAGRPNARGIEFYRRLLTRLREQGIASFVTLYHGDLPQWLEERGGWLNRDTAYRFAEYADLVSRELAGLASAWTTLNEPWCSAWLGYGTGEHAPGLASPRCAVQAMHHLLLGHGLATSILRRNDPQALRGLATLTAAVEPDSPLDLDAAALADARINRWVLDAVLLGRYPDELWELAPGTEPLVLADDMGIIATAPQNYLGINYYFRMAVRASGPAAFEEVHTPGVERTQMGWQVYPEGLRDMLLRLKNDYPDLPPLYVTGNGMAGNEPLVNGGVDDTQRVAYLGRHIDATAQAMRAGVDVRGYFAWSLLDNFEWAWGYERRFGLVHVDYATQRRTLKRSAQALRAFLAERQPR
jgi:beta-glucosidase